MEGPSIYLAAEQLLPFINETIDYVEGNTKIGKERLIGKTIKSIFSHGKVLFFQFDTFALRIHFLLWGSFEAVINQKNITGDYKKKNRIPRLLIKWIESSHSKDQCDYSTDIMSNEWDSQKCLLTLKKHAEDEISDVLLDQNVFSGVGNIIRNEVLFREKILPFTKVKDLSTKKLKSIIQTTKIFVFEFYEWRKSFILKKHLDVYRKSECPVCHAKIVRKKTGQRKRMSFFCLNCQK